MKDIKTFLIGFLTCACLFLIMGAGNSSEVGRYQLTTGVVNYNNEDWIYGALFDTKTAEIINRYAMSGHSYRTGSAFRSIWPYKKTSKQEKLIK